MARILKYAASILLAVLLAGYLLFHLLSGTEKSVTLFTVKSGSFDDTVTVSALLFRESSLLCSHYRSGTVIYSREEGEKVSAGSAVASVYENTDAQTERELENIEKKIALLEKSRPSAADTVEGLDEEISRVHAEITALTGKGELGGVAGLEDELTVLTNKRRLLITGESGFDAEIEALTKQKRVLLSLLGEESETVYADASGYFFSRAEGTAENLPASEILSLSVSGWRSLAAGAAGTSSSSCIGVLMTDPTWYTAFLLDSETAEALTVGRKYTVRFPDNTENGDMPMILRKVTVEGETALVVFSCSSVLPDFDFSYSQRAELVLRTYSGYKIPSEAVKTDEETGETFVYIFKKGFAAARFVSVLLSKDGYSIVRTEESLALYDRIILSREPLYEGKLID